MPTCIECGQETVLAVVWHGVTVCRKCMWTNHRQEAVSLSYGYWDSGWLEANSRPLAIPMSRLEGF